MNDPLGTWPKSYDDAWNKERTRTWFSTATPGEAEACNKVAKGFHAWEANPANGWFGMDVDPNKRKSVLMALCQQYGCPYGPATYIWPINPHLA